MSKDQALTDHQKLVVAAFKQKNKDIDIVVIYTRIYGDPGDLTARECQQKLAPSFAEVNRRSLTLHIEPGHLKRTYRCATPKHKG